MVVKFQKKLWESHEPESCKAKLGQKAQWHPRQLSIFFFRNSRTPLCQSSENGVRTCQIADFQPDLWRNMVWYGMFYWHFTDIFFYKKPIYKKPRATEAENLRNWRATFLAPKKLFYWETENRQFFTKIGPKITKKSEN